MMHSATASATAVLPIPPAPTIVSRRWRGVTVAEDAAQSADLDLEVGFLNERVRPGSGDQPLLAGYLARAFDQGSWNVECAAAEPVPTRRPAKRWNRPNEMKVPLWLLPAPQAGSGAPSSSRGRFAATRSAVPKPSVNRA